jgi:hypothetical protein
MVYNLGYARTSYGICKIKKKMYFMMNTELSGPDLRLAAGDPDVRTFDLGAQFLSLLYFRVRL